MASGSPLTGITSVASPTTVHAPARWGRAGRSGAGATGAMASSASVTSQLFICRGGRCRRGQYAGHRVHFGLAQLLPHLRHEVRPHGLVLGRQLLRLDGNGSPAMTSTNRYFPYPTQVTNLGVVWCQRHRELLELQRLRQHERRKRILLGLQRLRRPRQRPQHRLPNVPSQVLTAAAPRSPTWQRCSTGTASCAPSKRTAASGAGPARRASNYYAAQLKDSQSNRVTALTIVGRDCYLDTDDQVWVNGSTSTSYQVTCP